MTTWQANLDRDARTWLVWAEIVGIGDSDGLWRISSADGWTLGSGDGSWRPWLADLPDILSERVPFLTGGAVDTGGGTSLSVVDLEGQATDLLAATDRGRVARLEAQVDDDDTQLSVDAVPAGLSAGDILWLGSEAVEVTGTGTGTIDVTRGRLGTAGRVHITGAPVYERPQYIRHRELTLYLAPLDGAEAEKRVVGVYSIESLRYDRQHAVLEIDAAVRAPYLDRRVPRLPETTRVTDTIVRGEVRLGRIDPDPFSKLIVADRLTQPISTAQTRTIEGTDYQIVILGEDGEPDSELFEFLWVSGVDGMATQNWITQETGRRHARSKGDDLPEPDTLMRRVMSVQNGDFAYASPATSDRQSADWVSVDTWVEVLLCILLSPAVEGQDADNFDAGGAGWAGRNWSGLVPGYGCGVSYEDIDFSSFERVAADPGGRNYRIPFFVLGRVTKRLQDVVDGLLRMAGAYLVRERGQLRLVAPSPVLAEQSGSATVDSDAVLMRGDVPDVEVGQTDDTVTEVRVEFRPEAPPIIQTWADQQRLFDPLDLYQLEERVLEVTVPGASETEREILISLAQRQLRQGYRPFVDLACAVDVGAFWDAVLGELVSVDLPGVADYQGSRGLVGTGQVREHELRLDRRRGAWIETRLAVSPLVRAARVSATALVTAVDGSVATVADNEFTSADAPSPLPITDDAAFAPDDVVRLVDACGAEAGGGGTETVVSTGGATFEWDWVSEDPTNGTKELDPATATEIQAVAAEVTGASTGFANGQAIVELTVPFTVSFQFDPAENGSQIDTYAVGIMPTSEDIGVSPYLSGKDLPVDCVEATTANPGNFYGDGFNAIRRLNTSAGSFGGPGQVVNSALSPWGSSSVFEVSVDASGVYRFALDGTQLYSSSGHTDSSYYLVMGFWYGARLTDESRLYNITGLPEPGREIELSGDFSGNLAANTFLVFADEDDVVARQRDQYVFFDEDWEYG